jgi:hypothetical protein
MIILLFTLPILSSISILSLGRFTGVYGTKVIALISGYLCIIITIKELIIQLRYNNEYKIKL